MVSGALLLSLGLMSPVVSANSGGSDVMAPGVIEFYPSVTVAAGTYCLSATTCQLTVIITKGDAIIVAAQTPAGSASASDSPSFGNSWTTVISQSGGTGDQGSIFTVKTSNSGGSDTVKVTSSVAGTMAIEVFDVSGLASFTTVTASGSCTSSCSSSLSTNTISYTRPMFVVASLWARPSSGYTGSCNGSGEPSLGPLFSGVCETANPWSAAEYAYSPRDSSHYGFNPSTNFPATNDVSTNQWLDVGVAFESAYAFTNLKVTWTVPPAPTGSFCSNCVQNVALWAGLQQDSGANTVIQPILVYGCDQLTFFSCSLGGVKWWITPFAVIDGGGHNGATINVNVGDTIVGTINRNTADSNCGGSQGYDVTVQDTTAPGSPSTTSSFCTSENFNEAIVGTIEANNLNYCNQLPNTSSETFTWNTYSVAWAGGSLNTGHYVSWNNQCSDGVSWGSGYGSTTVSWSTTGSF